MYGASLTKTAMGYTALTLVDQGRLDLDAPLAGDLERPPIGYGEGEAHLAKYGRQPEATSREPRAESAKRSLQFSPHHVIVGHLMRLCG